MINENSKNIKKSEINKLKKIAITLALLTIAMMNKVKVAASSIDKSKAVTGTIKLFDDLANAGLLISTGLTSVTLIILLLKKQAPLTEDNDAKLINKRMQGVLIAGVCVFLVSGTVKLVVGYYK